ncbi:glycosyltransferase [Solidesulfovibrio carbinolicus]|uniref:glycosyltransferase n=1 Tax=Solidesulfovibrio carbinolicus TaxID=296842 RepID=UPI0013EBCAE0|nr:glycosyltransferase [Solidesulfovibrio carbinolicus]
MESILLLLKKYVAWAANLYIFFKKYRPSFVAEIVASDAAYLISVVLSRKILTLPYLETGDSQAINAPSPAKSFTLTRKKSHSLYCGSLASGGAERQVTALACELKARGQNVSVYCQQLKSAAHKHYLSHLQEADVPVKSPGLYAIVRALLHLLWTKRDISIFQYIPPAIRINVLRLYGELLSSPPDILHCWLDHTNCSGGWAGLLAGVPLVRLSFRNMNPTRLPYLYAPWMHATYRVLAMHPNVTFEANSTLGGHDYADWVGISRDRVSIIPNGVYQAAFHKPHRQEISATRQSLGIASDTPLVCCVFRLSPEKRPLDMISILLQLRRLLPNAHLIHAGVGPMEEDIKEAIQQNNLADCFHLLGRRKDIPRLLCASDVLLLPSEYEGMPNVILESLFFARPVVATYAGGAPEIVIPGENGFLHRPGDISGLTQSLHKLLVDRQLNRQFGTAGQQRILSDFTSCRMAEMTLRSYDYSLAKIYG